MANETEPRILPEFVLARWAAQDWDDETMTASHYTYEDGDGNPIELTESENNRYSWGYCEDNITGGSQGGWLRSAGNEPDSI